MAQGETERSEAARRRVRAAFARKQKLSVETRDQLERARQEQQIVSAARAVFFELATEHRFR